ncbi:pentatricopeptide repeat-containing protein [Tanacetum coccineum]|uniref:Pentatricopeptide repeat-containing protein n=1 Tax=Tanacetum coccineum TaxID=301880 RepID=A0ABQ5E0W8_9ASTR
MSASSGNDLAFEVNNDGVTGDGIAGDEANLDEEVRARKLLDKGKGIMIQEDNPKRKRKSLPKGNGIEIDENDNQSLIDESESKTDCDFGTHIPNHIDVGLDYNMHSDSESNYSQRFVDYLSDGEEHVIQLTKRESEAKTLPKTPLFWHVIPAGGNLYEVRNGYQAFKVDKSLRTCSCRIWKVSRIACPHVVHLSLQSILDSIQRHLLLARMWFCEYIADVEGSNAPEVEVDNVGHVRGSSVADARVSGKDNVVQTRREKSVMFTYIVESSVEGSCGDKVVQQRAYNLDVRLRNKNREDCNTRLQLIMIDNKKEEERA